MQILSYIFSTTGLAAIVASLLIKGKRMTLILFFVALGNVLMGLSYLCIGKESGAYTSFIATAQAMINYFYKRKDKPIPIGLVIIYAASFVTINLMVFTSLFDLLAIAASITAVMIICSKNGKIFRRWSLSNNLIWCLYDIATHSYGTLISHAVFAGFTAVGIFVHDFKKSPSAK